MLISQHFVIVLYFIETCLSAVAVAICLLEKRVFLGLHKDVLALAVLFVIRLIVKLFYFYVEFYINQLSLNLLMNFAMDSTYVLCMILTARILAKLLFPAARLPGGKTLPIIGSMASFTYVFFWMAIEILWVDRASNHQIVIYGQTQQLLYFANEAFFLITVLAFGIVFLGKAHQELVGFKVRVTSVAIVVSCLYAAYVFLWDVSFVIPSFEGVRSAKPLDGVLVFCGAFLTLFYLVVLQERKEGVFDRSIPVDSETQLQAFSAHLDLTAREGEVLGLLYGGKTYVEISEELYISLNTVKRHASNIYKKCGIHTRSQLISKINSFVYNDKQKAPKTPDWQ